MDSVSRIIQHKIDTFKIEKAKLYKQFKSAVKEHRVIDADYHETEMATLDRVIYEMEKLETKIATAYIKGNL
jgi:hypothetical protein